MKTNFPSKTLAVMAAVMMATVSYRSLANEQPAASPAVDTALPDGIALGSPVGQVFKLAQAGVDVGVIQNYISNCPSLFNLDADKIIALTDAGLPNDVIHSMFSHDKELALSSPAPAPVTEIAAAPTPATNTEADTPVVAPTEPLNLIVVNQSLSPYGTWVEVPGYGRCWRPNVVVYDSGWRPYCDRGRWVYSDCGWYWDSDYAWGVTFHYGRWFNAPNYGWCWWPDTVWAPSWVTWRSSNEYCGWAPLPPFTVYNPGIGFTYRGNHVAWSFGFGLAANCYTFVTAGNFCQPHPRFHCVPQLQVAQVYNQTTIINDFGHHDHAIVNNGVSVTVIGQASRHPIQAVPIRNLVNPGRNSWHGQTLNTSGRHYGSDTTDGSNYRGYSNSGNHRDNGSPNNENRNYNNERHPVNVTSTANTTGTSAPDNRREQHNPSTFTREGNTPSRVTPPISTPANRNTQITATAPARNAWTARTLPPNSDNRQNINRNTISQPVVVQSSPARVEAPRWPNQTRTYSAPAPVTSVPQHSNPRQSVAAVAPHNFAPSIPVAPPTVQPAQAQNNSGRAQGWMAKNR